jgi:F0F1-type ATP synthase membrane subunit c/vacuolar-type H+-ATPase subunit K
LPDKDKYVTKEEDDARQDARNGRNAHAAVGYYWRGDTLETPETDAIDKGLRTLWFIWAAMLGSLLIYILICHQLGEGFKGTEGTDVPIGLLRNILFGVAAAELIMSFALRRFMLKGRLNAFSRSSAMSQPPFVGHYTIAVIISLALSESVGIYGLVLFVLGGGFQTLYTFIGVAALAMVFYRPKREEMEQLAMAYNKQAGASPEIDRSGMK